jgi:hypothetical protein
MSAPKVTQVWLVGLLLAVTVGLAALFAPHIASVQRDNPHPSCYACHTWEDPVVEQGEWHTIHALQKNCCACHGGNDRTIDQAAAHAGMTSNPLDNPKLSCQHCHPADYQQRTVGVAVALGLTPSNHEPAALSLAAAPTSASSTMTPWPQISFREWDWPVELAVAIVVLGLGVMRWRRIHSS